MRPLTKQEIKFVKDTGFTPTVYQCGEYYKTIFTRESIAYDQFKTAEMYRKYKAAYEKKCYKAAETCAKEKYGFDLQEFLDKNLGEALEDSDSISLEETATYLFYCFFTKSQLRKLKDEEAIKFLKDYKYFFGYRKWEKGALPYVKEALEVYSRKRVFYLDERGNVCNILKENIENLDIKNINFLK